MLRSVLCILLTVSGLTACQRHPASDAMLPFELFLEAARQKEPPVLSTHGQFVIAAVTQSIEITIARDQIEQPEHGFAILQQALAASSQRIVASAQEQYPNADVITLAFHMIDHQRSNWSGKSGCVVISYRFQILALRETLPDRVWPLRRPKALQLVYY